jgi:hypothetical protein
VLGHAEVLDLVCARRDQDRGLGLGARERRRDRQIAANVPES